MASYDSLLKELNVQEEIEGRSDNIDLCRLIVKHLKTNASPVVKSRKEAFKTIFIFFT